MSKFFYTLIASFFFIDALGRRKSLFIGITIQMISDTYLGVFLKYKQAGPVASGSSQGAIAAIYIHGFGYAVGKSSDTTFNMAHDSHFQVCLYFLTFSVPSCGRTT